MTARHHLPVKPNEGRWSAYDPECRDRDEARRVLECSIALRGVQNSKAFGGTAARAAGRLRGFARRRPWIRGAVALALAGITGYSIYSSTTTAEPNGITVVVAMKTSRTVTALGNLQPR
mgnify:CR=1 FL=1